ncbi:SIR2 family NAD-dependent protein deacylase [Halomonas denitrificans]|nr:NAD-dependent deacylase [Halomonas denitrificans]
MTLDRTLLNEARDALRAADRVAVLTGAGVSAESNIPTFRDAQTGMWARFDPRQLASPEGFAEAPDRVWNWYRWRRELVASSRPNAGHDALATLQRSRPGVTLITQNVDGFHQQAGARDVLELHGSLQRTVCSVTRRVIDQDWLDEHADAEPPPSPHHPDGLARPDVVWFGEALPAAVIDAALDAAARCDLILVAGTSGEVHPAASLPFIARDHGARVIDVNPEATAISRMADWHLAGPSARWLPALICSA